MGCVWGEGRGVIWVVCGPDKRTRAADRRIRPPCTDLINAGPKRRPFGIYGRRGPVRVLYYIYIRHGLYRYRYNILLRMKIFSDPRLQMCRISPLHNIYVCSPFFPLPTPDQPQTIILFRFSLPVCCFRIFGPVLVGTMSGEKKLVHYSTVSRGILFLFFFYFVGGRVQITGAGSISDKTTKTDCRETVFGTVPLLLNSPIISGASVFYS